MRRRSSPQRLNFILVLLVVGSIACSSRKTEGTRYALAGTVLSANDGAGRIVVAHDSIPGFMPAMTMPYKVAAGNPAVSMGDQVKATLAVSEETEWLEDITVVKKADGGFTPIQTPSTAAVMGTEVPDFLLHDQDDRPIHLHQFRGEILMLTFIYTRCPFPDFCPLMMKNFKEVKRALDADPEVSRQARYLSISLDPAYDTPAVLRAYGTRFIPGDDRFARWTLATAAPAQIRPMATYFGVSYRKDGEQISHSLSTAIIGADGKLVSLMGDNAWRPGDAVTTLRQAAARHNP